MKPCTIQPLAVAALLWAAAAGTAYAQPTGQRPPVDFLPAIQATQAAVDELKSACLEKYPDMREAIEQAHREWVLYPVKIVVLLNGKEYVSPTITAMRQLTRTRTQSQDEQALKRDCDDFRTGLNKVTAAIPKEALAPFLPSAPTK